jgi:NADPH-dependent 2,4-dienoyl-CoA reductase/sulfur reductase-like enzyme
MADRQLIVVGAGPAGVRAAQTLLAAGLRPIVIDESKRDGGQVYRRQPANFNRPYAALYGTEAKRAESLHQAFDALRARVDYRSNTLAWNIQDHHLHVVEGGVSSAVRFDALIAACGATDRLMPVPGWNRAGVYSLGAAQIALKSQACAIGQKVVFAGTGPLLYLVASQYVKAGAQVAAVLDTSKAGLRLKALAKLMSRPSTLLKGIQLTSGLRRSGVVVEAGVTLIEISGNASSGVESIRVRTAAGAERIYACDAVGLGFHLRPETQLADIARCSFFYEAQSRQWLPTVDVDGRTSVAGVYLAGDGARLFGADGAEAAGELAALAVLKDLGRPSQEKRAAQLRKTLARMDRFRKGLTEAFPWPANFAANLPDSTVVCRCETITAREIRNAVQEKGAHEINRVKAFSRAGMGRCQGRYCAHATAEIVAAAADLSVEQVGRLRCQAPIKPLPVAANEARP